MINSRGYGPTVREIGEVLGISSPNGVMCHLRALVKKGKITRIANRSRAIELTEKSHRLRENFLLPLRGTATAEHCTFMPKDKEEAVKIADMLSQENGFALRVSGSSLHSILIDDGDILIFEQVDTAKAGEIILGEIDDQAPILAYLYPEIGQIRLQPLNRELKSIYSKSVKVLGIVKAIVRPKINLPSTSDR
jgi:repressor LexA